MRTTLSLDEDVAKLVDEVRRNRKASLKNVVNEALRGGLEQMLQPVKRTHPFITRSVDLGECYFANLDNTWEVLAEAEGECINNVILLDVNLLVYAWDSRSPEHAAAKLWLNERLSEGSRVGIPWETALGFLRVVTNPRIYSKPATIQAAWMQVQEWLACSNVWIPQPGPDHERILMGMLQNLGGGSKLIPDAHLAALAIGHGVVLCSSGGDFARCRALRWLNPIAVPTK